MINTIAGAILRSTIFSLFEKNTVAELSVEDFTLLYLSIEELYSKSIHEDWRITSENMSEKERYIGRRFVAATRVMPTFSFLHLLEQQVYAVRKIYDGLRLYRICMLPVLIVGIFDSTALFTQIILVNMQNERIFCYRREKFHSDKAKQIGKNIDEWLINESYDDIDRTCAMFDMEAAERDYWKGKEHELVNYFKCEYQLND